MPAKGAEQSVVPRVAWQDVTSDVCAMGPALQYPRPVISNHSTSLGFSSHVGVTTWSQRNFGTLYMVTSPAYQALL